MLPYFRLCFYHEASHCTNEAPFSPVPIVTDVIVRSEQPHVLCSLSSIRKKAQSPFTRSSCGSDTLADRFAVSTGKLIARSSAYGRPRCRPLIIMAQITNLLNGL